MNHNLHLPDELKKNVRVNDVLFELYNEVLGLDLKCKCVDSGFESFYDKYNEEANQYTPQSVAREIQNKLSADSYKDTILLDIIDLTELSSPDGLYWRALFKDIYDQRESIRYNLGSEDERKAINVMLKKKNPALMQKMAEVSERDDAMSVLYNVENVISQMEHEAHIQMLGAYVERNMQNFIQEALTSVGVTVDNQQGGQDFLLKKDVYTDYHVEIKSRWESDQSVEMSPKQFEVAVDDADNYALIGVNMYHFDQERAKRNDVLRIEEIYDNIKVLDNIGSLEADLRRRTDEAFKGELQDIRLNGSYKVCVPQDVFKAYPLDFNGLIRKLKMRFTNLTNCNGNTL